MRQRLIREKKRTLVADKRVRPLDKRQQEMETRKTTIGNKQLAKKRSQHLNKSL
jgi:hypothetical protein